MRCLTALGILAAAALSLSAQGPSRPPDLKAVLARAAAYVEEFRQELSGIVAEETYEQQEIPGNRRNLPYVAVASIRRQYWLDGERRAGKTFVYRSNIAVGTRRPDRGSD